MVLIPLILNYGINTNAMEIARFALMAYCVAYYPLGHRDAWERMCHLDETCVVT
jgi:hypothetical protein